MSDDRTKEIGKAAAWTFRRHGKYIGKAIEGTNLLFLSSMAEGSTLNLCCGFDSTGDILVDADLTTLRARQSTLTQKVMVNADIENLPFKVDSFDTIICDPPFSFYSKHRWVFSLFDIARKNRLWYLFERQQP